MHSDKYVYLLNKFQILNSIQKKKTKKKWWEKNIDNEFDSSNPINTCKKIVKELEILNYIQVFSKNITMQAILSTWILFSS